MADEIWFFAFRVIDSLNGPGTWVAQGSYSSRQDAQAAAMKEARNPDAQVGLVFSAASRAEADEKAATFG